MDFTYTCEGKSEPVSNFAIPLGRKFARTGDCDLFCRLGKQRKVNPFCPLDSRRHTGRGAGTGVCQRPLLGGQLCGHEREACAGGCLAARNELCRRCNGSQCIASAYQQLALTELFPAGWEILNTRYLHGGQTDSTALGVSYQDIRDDRGLYLHRQASGGAATDGAHQSLRRLSRSFLFASCLLRGDV